MMSGYYHLLTHVSMQLAAKGDNQPRTHTQEPQDVPVNQLYCTIIIVIYFTNHE